MKHSIISLAVHLGQVHHLVGEQGLGDRSGAELGCRLGCRRHRQECSLEIGPWSVVDKQGFCRSGRQLGSLGCGHRQSAGCRPLRCPVVRHSSQEFEQGCLPRSEADSLERLQRQLGPVGSHQSESSQTARQMALEWLLRLTRVGRKWVN